MIVIKTLFLASLLFCDAFNIPNHFGVRRSIALSSQIADEAEVVSLSLKKPLGIFLEEAVDGQPNGVLVKEVGSDGSAADYCEQITGAKLAKIGGQDVTGLLFDDVMATLRNAPDTVDLEFLIKRRKTYSIGTPVTITVKQPDKGDLVIEAKVGDNLRAVLLENGFEVYQGIKQKLGNCGGGGQCTFCAMDFLESDGWDARSEYEENKLKKNPMARLACLNNIQGPATLQKAPR